MVRGVSAREKCPNDILITLLEGEKGFEQIVETFKDKYSRGTINKYLNELFESGLVTRKGRRGPYILTPKGKEEAEKIRSDIKLFEESRELPLQEKERLIREIERLKRLNRIHELESLYTKVLPLQTVIKKLVDEYGFKIEDFYDRQRLKDPEFQKMFQKFRRGKFDHFITPNRLIHYYDLGPPIEPNRIEIKLIHEEEIEGVTVANHETNRKIKMLTPNEVARKYGSGWVILAAKPIKGYYIIGAYKELLQLYMEQFEDDWLKWKEEFRLSDEDWKRIGPYVALKQMIIEEGRVDLPIMVENMLYEYVQSMNPECLETLTKYYMEWLGLKRAEAEERAKNVVESMRELRTRPIEEIWKKYEEEVTKLGNEEWQRIFQYLKAKYGPR